MTDPDQGDDLDQNAQLDPEDTLVDRGTDPLDEGYSPPERPYAVDDFGTTPQEEREGEPLDDKLDRELPDPDVDPADAERGVADEDAQDIAVASEEAGEERSGRLAATGGTFVDDQELFAEDEGFAGGAASAEEAAVHVVHDE